MKSFKEFNIKAPVKGLEGEKIKISKILNREVIVHRFKIEPSKVFSAKGSTKCLHIEIEMNEKKHVVFTGSSGLIETITQVTESCFPFKTTIIEENDRYLFT